MTPTITTGNPLAPRWFADSTCPEETPSGYRDAFFEYPMNFIVAASIFQSGLFITLDREADFMLREIQPQAYNVAGGGIVGLYRFRDGFGKNLSEDPLTNEMHGPIFPELWLPAGSRFFLDFDNTNNAFSVQIATILRGCKRFKL